MRLFCGFAAGTHESERERERDGCKLQGPKVAGMLTLSRFRSRTLNPKHL